VPCPRCGEPFVTAAAFRRHLATGHGMARRAHQPVGRLQRWWDSLGYLSLWFVVPLDALAVLTVFALVDRVHTELAVVAAGMATLPLVLVLSHRVFRQ